MTPAFAVLMALVFGAFCFFWFILGWAFPLFWIFSFMCGLGAFVFLCVAIAGAGKPKARS